MTKKSFIKKIVIGITGSIAAYKAIDIAKLLHDNNYDINLVLSSSAPKFISILTLKSLFPGKVYMANGDLGSHDEMLHISLAKSADLILIAPISANMIAKIAAGLSDCLLSTICLATEAPILIAPAMNKVMWENSITQINIKKLSKQNIQVLGPEIGNQACGDYGMGRMLNHMKIIEYIEKYNTSTLLKGKKIIITAGPTREKIDPVRYLSNYSSGKMGYAIAEIACLMGAEVILISGPTTLNPPSKAKVIFVESANDMLQEVTNNIEGVQIFIGAAAVADYKPETTQPQKIKKSDKSFTLMLQKNIDVIEYVKSNFPYIFSVGFAAESNNIKEYGYKKLTSKKLDMIVINDISDNKVFNKEENEIYIVFPNKEPIFIEKNNKIFIARKILEHLSDQLLKISN